MLFPSIWLLRLCDFYSSILLLPLSDDGVLLDFFAFLLLLVSFTFLLLLVSFANFVCFPPCMLSSASSNFCSNILLTRSHDRQSSKSLILC